MKKRRVLLALIVIITAAGCMDHSDHALDGHWLLPAATFEKGPTSGQFIDAANGVIPPFLHQQPIQGFSAIEKSEQDAFWVLTDNGNGLYLNSADHVLRMFRIDLQDNGRVEVRNSVYLSDPDRKIGFPIVASLKQYPNGQGNIPVDPWIREHRVLTGADIDPESFRQAYDGTFWIGDEFGPFLLHVDSTGKLLDSPYELPGVMSPQNPYLGDREPNLARSGGFEGMAINAERTRIFPMLEKPLSGNPDTLLGIYAFDLQNKSWIQEEPVGYYPLSSSEYQIGELTAIAGTSFLVIERDGLQGEQAEFKRLFIIDLSTADADGIVPKKLVADMLYIPDPRHIAGQTRTFSFPFETIEGVVCLDDRTVLVCNDNNYPSGVGRHVINGAPDDNEFVMLRFRTSLLEMGTRN